LGAGEYEGGVMLDPLPLTIPHIAEAAAACWGDAPALLETGETWSFNQLWAECQKAARAFLAHGIGNGDRIAIWAPNCRDWIVAAIGAMTAGATIVPLNTRLKGREAVELLRRTRARMLVTVQEFLGTNYPALLADQDLPDLENILVLRGSWDEFISRSSSGDEADVEAALARLSPEDISDIMFTSGTTGIPKGVLSTHSQIIPQFRTWIENTGLGEGERYLIVNPFFHSFGMKAGWVACLMAGAVIVPMPVFDVKAVIAAIERDRIAFLPGAPTIFQALLAEYEKQPFDTSSLRGGTTGAAVVPPVLIERIRSVLGMADIITAYGMTECTNITGCRRGDSAELIATTCGVAVPGNELRIVDDAGAALPAGEPGEILVRGIGVMKGYLDDPVATAEAIDGEGWLHTGDVGVLDDTGYLRITDRKKDMYISGGFNVYPAEVEKLLSSHPAIAQVAVIGVPDDRMGEMGKAFVILRPGSIVTPDDVIGWARDNMSNYKVPRAVAFVEALPLNASGKVMKTELR
jgi:HIP---CoA ligase